MTSQIRWRVAWQHQPAPSGCGMHLIRPQRCCRCSVSSNDAQILFASSGRDFALPLAFLSDLCTYRISSCYPSHSLPCPVPPVPWVCWPHPYTPEPYPCSLPRPHIPAPTGSPSLSISLLSVRSLEKRNHSCCGLDFFVLEG